MTAPIVDSIRANGWRVSLHEDGTFTLAGEGARFEADQVALMLALGGTLPARMTEIVRMLSAWQTHAPGVPGTQVLDLARKTAQQRATLAGEAAGKGPLMPLFVRDPDELVRQAAAVVLPDGKAAHPWFEVLSQDPSALVRACIAINPHTPTAIRRALMDDPSDAVALAATRNPSPAKVKPTKAQQRRAQAPTFSGRGGSDLRDVDQAWLAIAKSDDMTTRLNVAARDDAPESTLLHLMNVDHASLGTVLATLRRTSNRGWQ